MADPLMERLRRALAADYDVEFVIASGGMGVVFRARDRTLDRLVAIKLIRPEVATAVAAERFLREARMLARLRHPRIVAVHRAGEAEGLPYYVMDYLEGETLASRLASGPLDRDQILSLAADLLEALEAVHGAGIVHRDVKPGNIFLVDGRVVLSDFGIAKEHGTDPLTEPGYAPGSPRYMAPEQLAGDEVTSRTDIYAAGLVLYEAFTGQAFPAAGEPADADWRQVPQRPAAALQRALELSPSRRWRDVPSFRAALLGGAAPPKAKRRVLHGTTAAGLLALLILGVWQLWPSSVGGPARLEVVIEELRHRGPDARRVADSIIGQMEGSLQTPDLHVRRAPARGPAASAAALVVGVRVAVSDDSVTVELSDSRMRSLLFVRTEPTARWAALADTAANQLLHRLYSGDAAGPLPVDALPRTPYARQRALRGEQLLGQGRWQEAYRAYQDADLVDTTCVLCAWRLNDIQRWFGRSPDGRRIARVSAELDRFTDPYRAVIRASRQPSTVRLDSLFAVTTRWPDFLPAWFIHGEELFHRGPLAGRPRAEARRSFGQATIIRPGFAPAWEHLAWLLTAEGDSAGAADALRHLEAVAVPDTFTLAYHVLLNVGFAWRFLPKGMARALTDSMLADPAVAAFPDVGGGIRMLLSFDAPDGAVVIGQRLTELKVPKLDLSGRIAQVTGHLALGRPAAARREAQILRDQYQDPELQLFADQMDAAIVLFDNAEGGVSGEWKHGLRYLRQRVESRSAAPHERGRAAWLLALAVRHGGEDGEANQVAAVIPGRTPFATLTRADSLARRRRWDHALEGSTPALALDSGARADDPFFRAALHLKRAEWSAAWGDTLGARRELLWHQNIDVVGAVPRGPPQAAEVDWALGTLARWRLATLLDRAGEVGREVCDAYRAVARLWAEGEPFFQARADSARRRLDALKCAT